MKVISTTTAGPPSESASRGPAQKSEYDNHHEHKGDRQVICTSTMLLMIVRDRS
jgi:hypothetical protein